MPMTDADLVWVADFQPTDWPDIKTAYKLYTTWWFSHPMKLVLQNQVIGIGNVILFQNSAWLTQIIIRSTHQNQGFGTALTQALIDLVRDKVTGISLLASTLFINGMTLWRRHLHYYYHHITLIIIALCWILTDKLQGKTAPGYCKIICPRRRSW